MRELPKAWRQKALLIIKMGEYIVSQLCKITKIYELATIIRKEIQEK